MHSTSFSSRGRHGRSGRSGARRVVVALVVAGLGASALAACGVDVGSQRESRTTTYTINDNVSSIDANVNVGRVEVTGADVEQVTVRETREWTKKEPTATHAVDGKSLVLRGKCPNGVGSLLKRCSVRFVVEVPRGMATKAFVDTGAVAVKSVNGPVDLQTDTGAVTMSELSGQINAKTDTGAVIGDKLSAARSKLETDTGEIQLNYSSPPTLLEATTDTGQISVEVPSGVDYDVQTKVDTGSKDVSVATRTGAEHRIVATADTGKISIRNG